MRFQKLPLIGLTALSLGLGGFFMKPHHPALLSSASAQELGIVATVNNDIITQFDLTSRIGLVLLSTGSDDTAQNRRRIAQDVLNTLIEERLKLGAAENENITVRDAEIQTELGNISQRNNMTVERMTAMFAQRNVDISSLSDQVRSQIAWAKLVNRRLGRQVRITDADIQEELERLSNAGDKTQRRVFEILIPVENPEREAQMRQAVERLHEQLLNGASFSAMARNFSKSRSASLGGDMGWLSEGQMREELWDTVTGLQKGQISEPVRSVAGFHIFQLADTRSLEASEDTAELKLLQTIVSKDASEDEDTRQLIAEQARTVITGCEVGDDPIFTNLKTRVQDGVTLDKLSRAIRAAVEKLNVGETSEPIRLGKNLLLVTLCEKGEARGNLPPDSEIRALLQNQRLELLANRHLRDLKNAAFIDIRR